MRRRLSAGEKHRRAARRIYDEILAEDAQRKRFLARASAGVLARDTESARRAMRVEG